jgi:hypothetical protein
MKERTFGVAVLTGSLLSMAMIAPAFAQTTPAPSTGTPTGVHHGWGMGMIHQKPGVIGTVSAISGTTITVQTMARGTSAAQTFTVDASSATVTKDGQSSSVSSIAVGDFLMVQGTVSGTSVSATTIRDGKPMMGMRGTQGAHAQMPAIQGNGQPIVGGTVSSVSGNSLTVTTKSGIAYSVDATSATVTKAGASSTVASVAQGDSVIVQGTVNGTSVTASTIVDSGTASATTGTTATPSHRGFFGAVGGFFGGFMHMFGF